MTAAGDRRPRPVAAAAIAIAGLALGAALALTGPGLSGRWWEVALLTAGAVAAAIPEIRIGPGTYLSGTFVFCVIIAAFVGRAAAFVAPALVAGLAGPMHHARRLAILGNCAAIALPNVVGAALFGAWLPSDLTSWQTPAIIVAVSALAWAMNLAFATTFFALLDGQPLSQWIKPIPNHLPGIALTCVFAGSVGAVYAESALVGIAFAFALQLAVLYMARQTVGSLDRLERIERLAESRRILAADAAQAEERERRRIAERLHDDVLQTLLAARQDIVSGTRGDAERLRAAEAAVVDAVSELRQNVAQLHPAPTHAAGLATTLRAVVEAEARRGGFGVEVSVAPDLGDSHDRLLIGVVRELLVNVARHADAKDVRVAARAEDGRVVLAVADDGRGMSPDDRRRALAAGHVGLASITERVEALEGSVTITSPTGGDRGTIVTVSLPRST